MVCRAIHKHFGGDDITERQVHLHEFAIPKLLRKVIDEQVTALRPCRGGEREGERGRGREEEKNKNRERDRERKMKRGRKRALEWSLLQVFTGLNKVAVDLSVLKMLNLNLKNNNNIKIK